MKERELSKAGEIVEQADASLLEIIDHVLNKGVMIHGEVFLGVAGVDLVYLRLSSLVTAIDRLMPDPTRKKRRRNRGPRKLRPVK